MSQLEIRSWDFLELYGPVVRLIMCIVGEYSTEGVKRRRDILGVGVAGLHVQGFNYTESYSSNIADTLCLQSEGVIPADWSSRHQETVCCIINGT